jgi:hypothetical protein
MEKARLVAALLVRLEAVSLGAEFEDAGLVVTLEDVDAGLARSDGGAHGCLLG